MAGDKGNDQQESAQIELGITDVYVTYSDLMNVIREYEKEEEEFNISCI